MSEPTPLLGREGIEKAYRRLGDRLAKRGVVADIYVFGGADCVGSHSGPGCRVAGSAAAYPRVPPYEGTRSARSVPSTRKPEVSLRFTSALSHRSAVGLAATACGHPYCHSC